MVAKSESYVTYAISPLSIPRTATDLPVMPFGYGIQIMIGF